jgi:hypothetical protein
MELQHLPSHGKGRLVERLTYGSSAAPICQHPQHPPWGGTSAPASLLEQCRRTARRQCANGLGIRWQRAASPSRSCNRPSVASRMRSYLRTPPQLATEQPAKGAGKQKNDKSRQHWAERNAGRDDQPLRRDRNPAHGVMSVSHHLGNIAHARVDDMLTQARREKLSRSVIRRHSAIAKRFSRPFINQLTISVSMDS